MLKSQGRWERVSKAMHGQIKRWVLDEDWLSGNWYELLINLEKMGETFEMDVDEYVETGLDMKWEAALGLESPVYFETNHTIQPLPVSIVTIGKRQPAEEEMDKEEDEKDDKTDEADESGNQEEEKIAWEAKKKGFRGRLATSERHHFLLGIGGKEEKMEAKQAISDKANGTTSSVAPPSSSLTSSSTTPVIKSDEHNAADVRTCAQMIATACGKMAAISLATNIPKSGTSSGEDGDDETDSKQPLMPKRQKKAQKQARKSEKKPEPPAPVCNHPPDAKWNVNRNGDMEVFFHCCRTKKLVIIEGVPKHSFNVWKVMPQLCDSCGRRIKYVEYNDKIVEMKDVVSATLNYIW